jgi:competence protein ComEA
LKQLLERIGFSETEAKVSIFLVLTLVIGASAYYIEDSITSYESKEFDYSKIDSAFHSKNVKDIKHKDSLDLSNEIVDYNDELLDFSKKEIKSKSDSFTPLKIDINSANLATLIKLPGIGEKTAQRIIKFRDGRKKIVNLNELLEVKGIGKAKLEKLKKFLIIE